METKPMKLAGRCANGWERDRGSVFHAVPLEAEKSGWGIALCGAKPGRRSAGFTSKEGSSVTCPRCIRKLQQQDAQDILEEQESNYNRDIGASLRLASR